MTDTTEESPEELSEEEAKAAAEAEMAEQATKHGESLGRSFAPRVKAVANELAKAMNAEVMSRPMGAAGMPPSLAGELRLSDEVRAAILTAATQIVCTDALGHMIQGVAGPLQAVAGIMIDGATRPPSSGILTPGVPLNNPNRVNGKRKGKRK